jgi:nucleoside-diphosphate-sugar epimerase
MTPRTVLVAGASGVVGSAAARAFADAGWGVITASRHPPDITGTTPCALDLDDPAACRDFVSAHMEISHLVFAALYEQPGLVTGWLAQEQMDRNLAMLRHLLDPLAGTGALQHVSLLQGTKAYGAHVEPMAVPGRERSPRHRHENFYWLQEDHLRAVQATAGFTSTILRPQVVFGDAFGSNMNAIPALGVYAALLRAAGQPLHYPGGAPFLTEAVDADLVGRALLWAATSPAARNETFNITNGDVFTMRGVWPALADAFGMEVGDDVPMALSRSMPQRHGDWAALVERLGLRAPADLAAFVGQGFIYADVILAAGATSPPPPTLVSTVKIRQAGFGECTDTEDMFRALIERFQSRRWLPPRAW